MEKRGYTDTAEITVISPNFLVWKFFGKSTEFRAIRQKLCANCGFAQNFHTRKGEVTVLYEVRLSKTHLNTKKKQYTVFSPINGHSKRRTPLISGQFFFSPAQLWSKSHKKLSKRRTGN